jgi:hypothetical protein
VEGSAYRKIEELLLAWMHPGLEHTHQIPFSQKNLGLEITINDNLNMKYFNLNNNLNMKYIRAQHTQTSGCTNISTMIEIID